MLPKVKRTKTPEQALASLMRLAARAERSSGDALRLMRTWGVEPSQRQDILRKLIGMKFIDDSRYAESFVRDKLKFSGWGAHKIRTALRAKGIDAAVIEQALEQADSESMGQRLAARLERKMQSVKYATPYELKNKLMRYGLSLGYDFETVAEAVAQLIHTEE